MDTAKRCPKCTNHFNFAVIKGKGHKHECPFVDCSCSNCLKTNQQNIKSRMKYKKAAQGESSKSEKNCEEVYVFELADAVQEASSNVKEEDSLMNGLNFRTGTEAIVTRYSLESVKYENEVDNKCYICFLCQMREAISDGEGCERCITKGLVTQCNGCKQMKALKNNPICLECASH